MREQAPAYRLGRGLRPGMRQPLGGAGRERSGGRGGSGIQLPCDDKLVPQATGRNKWGLRADEGGWGVVRQPLEAEGGQKGDGETSLPQSPVFGNGDGTRPPWSRGGVQGHPIAWKLGPSGHDLRPHTQP